MPKSPLAHLAPDRQKVAPAVATLKMVPKLPFEEPVVGPPPKESLGRFVKPPKLPFEAPVKAHHPRVHRDGL
jgi:hypothetical protein